MEIPPKIEFYMNNYVSNTQLGLFNPLNESKSRLQKRNIREDKKDDWVFLKEAISIRKDLADSLSKGFIEKFDKESSRHIVENSLLKNLLDRLPFENTLEKLSFSLNLTEHAVKKVLSSDYTTLEKIGIVGYLMELSAREFIDPFNPTTTEKNLAASKQLGYFFTPTSLAFEMASLSKHSEKPVKRIFDPACGSGTLLALTLLVSSNIKEVVGIEIDPFTSLIAEKLVLRVAQEVNSKAKVTILNVDYLDFSSAKETKDKYEKYFDLVIMNPPYGRIRFISSNLTNLETKVGLDGLSAKELHDKLKKQHINNAAEYRRRFQHIGLDKGTPEYSTLFLASTLELVTKGGVLVAITPTSWLADQNGKGLRKYILDNHTVEEIWYFNETAKLFPGVNQPTAVILIKSGNFDVGIRIKSNITSLDEIHIDVHALEEDKLREFSPEWLRFPRYGNSRTQILAKIHKQKELLEYTNIYNLRGEFDLTLNKELISNETTLPRLIRGDHIEVFRLRETQESAKDGYVMFEKFVDKLGKSIKRKHIDQWRIALPQCTYLQKKKRIEACLVPPGNVISNSCNYIALETNNKDDLLLMCAYLNSLVVEWRFRLFNSNNHIANYEIDEFPMVDFQTDEKLKSILLDSLKHYSESNNVDSLINIDAIIAKSYDLTEPELLLLADDLKYPGKEELINKFRNL